MITNIPNRTESLLAHVCIGHEAINNVLTHDCRRQILRHLSSVISLKKPSSPMGNDCSPESQHNIGDTIIYDTQRQIS